MTKRQKEAGFLIAKIHQLSGRILSRRLKEQGIKEINPAQGRILSVLWREDGISIQQLAIKTQLAKSTLTSMLDRLESAGYIIRTPSGDDRREIIINLTEKDKQFRESYITIAAEMNGLIFDGFSDDEMVKFEGYLRRVLNNLTDYGKKNREQD